MNRHAVQLRILLRTLGVVCALAVIPLVMPAHWIDRAHQWIGLGSFPPVPTAEYLARSVSALSVFYGGLLLVLARDVRRSAPIIVYQAIAIIILSTYGIFAGVRAGLPLVWPLADAVGCWVFLLPILILSRRVAKTP